MARRVGSTAGDTRNRVLDAARALFVEQGYAGTSVRDISSRLGMTKGSLYYHFSSKEELLAALIDPLLEALDEFAVCAHASGAATAELLRTLVDRLDEHGPVLRSLWGDPSAVHQMIGRLRLPQRLAAVLEAMGATADPADRLRARCALGVINSGVLAPTEFAGPPDAGPAAASRRRLTDAEKRFVVDAALAVLTLPRPSAPG
jgi:AcrR family transcriptional regulator